MFKSIVDVMGLGWFVFLMFASAWVQFDGIELLITNEPVFMILIFAVSMTFLPPASLVWFIAGMITYF